MPKILIRVPLEVAKQLVKDGTVIIRAALFVLTLKFYRIIVSRATSIMSLNVV
jgi:hypothetical protein